MYKAVPVDETKVYVGNDLEKKDEEKTWPQVLAISVACLVALTSGLQSAWTSPSIVAITRDKVHYNISEDEASYLPILPSVSMILTCGLVSKLYDYFGRKWILMFTAVPQLSSWILIACASSVNVFYVSRILSGIGEACYFSVIPAYVGEISSPKVRGSWGNAVSSMRYLGSFLINVIGSKFTVWDTAYICMSLPIIFLLAMPFMPESPYFLIIRNKEEKAKKSIGYLKDKKNVDEDYTKLKADVQRQMSETGSWRDLIGIKSNRRGLLAAVFLRIAQSFGGMIAFNFYNQFIFNKATKSSGSAKLWSMVYSGLLCVCVFVASFVVDAIGRKKSFIFSLLACGSLLLIEAAYFYIDMNVPSVNLNLFIWFPVTGMLLYCVFCSFGIAIIPTLMLGELFSASIKAKGLTVLTVITAITIFVSNYVFYFLTSTKGLFAPFVLFGCFNVVSAILSVKIIPETKGKTLEEIQQKLKRSKR